MRSVKGNIGKLGIIMISLRMATTVSARAAPAPLDTAPGNVVQTRRAARLK